MRSARGNRSRTAVVALVDAHSAVIDRYADGVLARVRTILTTEPTGTSDHMGDAPRQTYHAGTRGETATDAAQRARAESLRRFIAKITPAVAAAAAHDEWIVIGGNRALAISLQESLAKHGHGAILAEGMFRALPAPAVIARVTEAIDASLAARDLTDVTALIERTGAHTTGVVGPIATMDAIEHGAADVVFMTAKFREHNAETVDRIVAAADTHGARVETVADGAADLLDASGGGVGTMLRFALHAIPAAAAAVRE